ncbi:hypothetical protein Plhal703r1_c39g0136671 [Plasmopara halstedii]
MVKLFCAIVGEQGSAFPVNIASSESVGDLKEEIAEKQKYDFAASKLQLFLARKGDSWLPDDDPAALQLEVGKVHNDIQVLINEEKMKATWTIKEVLKANNITRWRAPKSKHIHVLVVTPEQEQEKTRLWLVDGLVENALNTKGIRYRLFRLADSYIGYYDPDHRIGDQIQALWYDGTTLRVHVLFEKKEKALEFESVVRNERQTINSPLNGQVIKTSVTQVVQVSCELRRICYEHYDPQATESTQDTMSSISTNTTIVDVMTDEFRFQRIESEKWFGPLGKAQSCHLMSREHCRRYESYHKYDNDKSNRLALSSEMHGWYDALTVSVPVMNIRVESVSPHSVISNRFEIKLIVSALDAGYGELISLRMKDGFAASDDRLEMQTCVYIENPMVFCECIEWKRKQIKQRWQEYFDMTSTTD